MDEQLLTPTELRSRLKISRRHYARMIKAGRLPYRLIGSLKRFVWADVVSQLPSERHTPSTKHPKPTLDLTAALKHRARARA